MNALQVEQVSFNYGGKLALDQVSFGIESARLNALLGPNGAGKSTLMALFSRLYQLQQGDIRVGGLSLRQQPRQALRRLGVVFQQSTLDLDLSVHQNLAYHAALHGLTRRAAAPRIEQELARQSLLEHRNQRVRELNGGHRRRVEIARALLHQPDILLLDEASAGLDPASRLALNQHIRTLCAERQITVVWTTHLMDEIALNDPVIVLHRGRVLAADNAADIIAQTGHANLSEAFRHMTQSSGADA